MVDRDQLRAVALAADARQRAKEAAAPGPLAGTTDGKPNERGRALSSHLIICGPEDCPLDDRFEHDNYFGCVPKNFSPATGRAKGHRQTPTEIGLPWKVHLWGGGCDAAGATTKRKLAEYQRVEV